MATPSTDTGTGTGDVVDELNDLIQLDHDAVQAYAQAIDRVDAEDGDVRADLESFRADHERHITDLQRVVVQLGGEPREPGRDLKGVLLEGMTALRSATGTLGALKAMRMNEKLTNRSYSNACDLRLPLEARRVIARNFEDERRHLAAIRAHIARLDATDEDVAEEEEVVDADADADLDRDDRESVPGGAHPVT